MEDAQRKSASAGLHELIVSCPELPLILTSRNDPLLTDFPMLSRWSIAPLVRAKAYQLIQQYESDKDMADRLISALQRRPRGDAIETFIRAPLLVVLLVASYKEKQLIPTQVSSFYWQVYDALFEKHDSAKGGFVRKRVSGLALDQFHRVLRTLGFLFLSKGTTSFDKVTFFETCDEIAKLLPEVRFQANDLLQDLLKAVPLVVSEGATYRFVHKTMIDYFAAEFICRDLKEGHAQYLVTIYKTRLVHRYSEVLRFCADIDYGTFKRSFLKEVARDVISFARKYRCDLRLEKRSTPVQGAGIFQYDVCPASFYDQERANACV